MSDDLISRKALMEEIGSLYVFVSGIRAEKGFLASIMEEYKKSVFKCIEEAPTVYDVDAVCEELENYLFEKYCIEGDTKVDEIVRNWGKKNESSN